jgi:O-methyltransferase
MRSNSIYRILLRVHYVLTVPISIFFILNSANICSEFRMTGLRKFVLGWRMFLNTVRIRTGTSYKSHLAMALKILETPPTVAGAIVECGTWKGGSAANLSLVCEITGRRLLIFDSFEGLPRGESGDREARHYHSGDYCGTLDEVKANIARYGALECCEFIKGWFKDTLPRLDVPVLLAFLDVDLEASLDICVRCIWPNLTERGYLFIDECVGIDYCSLFFSERYWKTYFDRTPPGLIGAGTGLALGEYYIGPWSDRGNHPLQHANAGAYTRKDLSGCWTYYPDA